MWFQRLKIWGGGGKILLLEFLKSQKLGHIINSISTDIMLLINAINPEFFVCVENIKVLCDYYLFNN